jgi:hypothetical protein
VLIRYMLLNMLPPPRKLKHNYIKRPLNVTHLCTSNTYLKIFLKSVEMEGNQRQSRGYTRCHTALSNTALGQYTYIEETAQLLHGLMWPLQRLPW